MVTTIFNVDCTFPDMKYQKLIQRPLVVIGGNVSLISPAWSPELKGLLLDKKMKVPTGRNEKKTKI